MIVMSDDRYVSPYLLRPLRSYEEALRDRERRSPRARVPRDAARESSSDVAKTKEARVRTQGTGSEHP